jgi:glutathionylspermidine synthase
MERLSLTPRNDWRRRAEEIGFAFHTIGGKPYWDETAAYLFTAEEIDAIDDATAELERICLTAVDKVVKENLFAPFGIGEAAAKLARDSWTRGERNLYGRFDLRVAPGEAPKLYEYNADTPTALFEASVVQWEWLATAYPGDDQFNSIHEKLIAAWPQLKLPGNRVHFTCVRDHDEDRGTVDYLRDTATQAGLDAPFLFIDEIGWNGIAFTDLEERQIQALFKLYPWEWLMREEFAANIAGSAMRVIASRCRRRRRDRRDLRRHLAVAGAVVALTVSDTGELRCRRHVALARVGKRGGAVGAVARALARRLVGEVLALREVLVAARAEGDRRGPEQDQTDGLGTPHVTHPP